MNKIRLHITFSREFVDRLRERRRRHGVSVSWQIHHFATVGMQVEQALATCGIAGIYGEFTGPTDAIEQMATYIKERDDEVMPMDTLEIKGES